MTPASTQLETRDRLPDALRVLMEDYPRHSWEHDPGFHGLISFWLERHLMFRKIVAQMQSDTEKFLNQDLSAKVYAGHLSRYGGMFVQELHGHHTIEDQHYFPKLIDLDSRISRGFDILDKDHHAIDGHLNAFVTSANGVLQNIEAPQKLKPAADALHRQLRGLEGLLNRHLVDEEELVVPVVLKYGAPDM